MFSRPSYLIFLFAAVVAYVGVRHFCVPSPRKPLADIAFLAATFGYTLATHPALAAILLTTGFAIKLALKIAPYYSLQNLDTSKWSCT